MLDRLLILAVLATVSTLVAAASSGAEVGAEDAPSWKGKVSLGGSLSRGNVNSLKGTLEAGAERAFDPHLVRLGLFAAYGESDSSGKNEVDNNKQELREYYRYSFSERFYAYGDSLQGRDTVQNIKFRFLANAGPGWRAWHAGEDQFLDLELGIGYRNESRRGDDNRSDVTGRLGAAFAQLIGPARFRQTGEFLLPLNDTGGWLAKARTSLSFPLTDAWSFENSLLLEYNNKPAASTKAFELDYIISLVYSF